jgi:DNA-binding transcriptional ArsR family regulator
MATTYQKRRWFARRPYVTKWYVHSKPALYGGIVAGIAEFLLIVRDGSGPNWTFANWTLEHTLAMPLVVLAIVCAHCAWQAFKEAKFLSCVGLSLCAVFFSGLIVIETTKRRADTREAVNAVRTFDADKQVALFDDYKRARGLAKQASDWMAAACKRNATSDNCKTQTFTFNQRQAHAEKLRVEVAGTKATAPVEPGLSVISAIAAKIGYDQKLVADIIRLADPVALPIGFQFASIWLFGLGIRSRKEYVAIEAVPALTVEAAPVEAPKMLTFEGPFSPEEIEELKRILGTHSELCNKDLAKKVGVSAGEMSRRVADYERCGLVEAQKVGKEKRIRLATSNGKLAA